MRQSIPIMFGVLITLAVICWCSNSVRAQTVQDPEFSKLCPEVQSTGRADDTEHNKAVVKCYLSGRLQNKGSALVDNIYALNAIVHRPLGINLDLNAVKATVSGKVLCDARTEFRGIAAEGATVAVLLTHHAVFCPGTKLMIPPAATGPKQPYSVPEGRTVTWDAQAWFQFGPDGRVTEEWVNLDTYAYLQALGVQIELK